MSIKPIDVQVMLSNLNNVGKEQFLQKEANALHQSQQASELVKKTDEKDHSVNNSKEVSEGPEKVDEKEAMMKQKKESGQQEKEKEKQEEKNKEIFTDPDLGHNIDISG